MIENIKVKIESVLEKHSIFIGFLIIWLIVIIVNSFQIYAAFHTDNYPDFYGQIIGVIIVFIAGFSVDLFFRNLLKNRDFIDSILISVMIFISLGSIPITHSIILFGDQLINKLEGFPIYGDYGDWINFIGIIIAGLITMLGITFTIKNEREIRKDDKLNEIEKLKLELMPIIEYNFNLTSNGLTTKETFVYGKIENNSGSHAKIYQVNIHGTLVELDEKDVDIVSYSEEHKFSIESPEQIYIAGKSSKNFPLHILLTPEIRNHLLQSTKSINFQIVIVLFYTDIREMQKYCYMNQQIIKINMINTFAGFQYQFKEINIPFTSSITLVK